MRIQGCFVSNREVESVVDFLKSGGQENTYDEEVTKKINELAENSGKNASKKGDNDFDGEGDDMLPQAIEVVVEAGQASTSLLQRRLHLKYVQASQLIDELERYGVIGPHEGSKPRQILLTRQQMLDMDFETKVPKDQAIGEQNYEAVDAVESKPEKETVKDDTTDPPEDYQEGEESIRRG